MANFISGRYTATWNGLAMGQTADGFRLKFTTFSRIITGDAYAETPQDAIYRGKDMSLAFRLIQYDAEAVATLTWPEAAFLAIGKVGRTYRGSGIAKALVLTAVAGTPAATTPASLTIVKCALKEGYPVEILFAPDLREVPLELRAFPDDDDGVGGSSDSVFGTQT